MKRAWQTFRRILPYVRPYRKLAVFSLIFTFLAAGVSIALPWPLAIMFDSVLGNKPLPAILAPLSSLDRFTLLVLLALAILGLKAAEGMVDVLNNYVTTKLDENIVLDFRSDMFQHAHRLSPAYHDGRLGGGMSLQLTVRSQSAGAIIVAIPALIQAIVTLVGMFVVAYFIDWQLALLALSVVPFIYYSTGHYARRIEPRLMKVRGMEGKSVSIAHEAMAMLRVVVPFGREPYEYRRFRNQGESAVDARVDLTVRQTMFSMVVNVITGVGIALVLGFGAYRTLHGHLSGGNLLVMMTYVAAAYAPLQQISGTFTALQEQFVYLRGALGILNTQPEVKDAPDAYEIGRAKGTLSFEGVDFRYQKSVDALKDISFEAQAGQPIAVVGPTGAGKTTLINLMTRFFDPQRGCIRLDGIDIRKLTLSSLRKQISIVMQEPLLFSSSIADNIRYGRLEASMEEVIAAAKAANVHQSIMRQPKKYRTKVGERGATLSGGERQRITIARAFLKDAPILILDEPTASVDSRTEAVILDSLKRLMVGRTTFIITHRLSAIRNADLILVLDQGRLVEQGTHGELLRRGGLFKQLHDAHAGRTPGKKRPGESRRQHRPEQGASVEAFITASPNPVPAGDGPGATTISWSTGEASSQGQVYFSKGGGLEKLFAGSAKGAKEVTWIRPNATYEFRLYTGKERSARLATVVVRRSDNVAQEPDKTHRNGSREAEPKKRGAKTPGPQESAEPASQVEQARKPAEDTSAEALAENASQQALTALPTGAAENAKVAHEPQRINRSEEIYSKPTNTNSWARHLLTCLPVIIKAGLYIRWEVRS
jgi:ATP-binding cassette, subfamily B, bacterial